MTLASFNARFWGKSRHPAGKSGHGETECRLVIIGHNYQQSPNALPVTG